MEIPDGTDSLMDQISIVKIKNSFSNLLLICNESWQPSQGCFTYLYSIITTGKGKTKQYPESNDHHKNSISITICSISAIIDQKTQNSTCLDLEQTIAPELPLTNSPFTDKSNPINPNLITALK